MKITFLGTGTCVQHVDSRAQSSILLESYGDGDIGRIMDGKLSKILVDCGPGTFMRLSDIKLNVNEIDAILLTHNHLDHNGDLLAILKARWLQKGAHLKIFGPKGTDEFLNSIVETYPYLKGKFEFVVDESDSFKVSDFEVSTISTYHSIVGRAYVIENKKKKIVISGDTRPFKQLIGIKCDVLVHELSLPFNIDTVDHTTPETLSEFLQFVQTEKIYLTHIYPHAFEIKEAILDHLRKFTDAEIIIPSDLDSLTV